MTITLDDGNVILQRDVGVVVRDGVRLSVDVYRPNRPGRYPAILEHKIPGEGWWVSESGVRWAMARDDDPLSAATWGHCHYHLKRAGLDTDARAEARFEATDEEFVVDLTLKVSVDGEPFAEQRWKERIPREGV